MELGCCYYYSPG